MTTATGTAISHARLLEWLCFADLTGLVEAGDVMLAVELVVRDVGNVEVAKVAPVGIRVVPVGVEVTVWRLLSPVVEVISVAVGLVLDEVVASLALDVSCVVVLLDDKWVSGVADAFTDVELLEDASELTAAEANFFVKASTVVVPRVPLAAVDFSLGVFFSLVFAVLCTDAIVLELVEMSNMFVSSPRMLT